MKRTLDTLYVTRQKPLDLASPPRGGLDRYIAEAVRVAQAVVDAAGIDTKDLPDDISPEVEQALGILFHAQQVRHHVDQNSAQNAALESIRLAQDVQRFNVDRGLLEPVNVYLATKHGGKKGSTALHGEPGSKAVEYRAAYQARRLAHPDESRTAARKEVAKQFPNLHGDNAYKTIERATKGQ